MTDPIPTADPPPPDADGDWFRPPTRREHLIACGLFIGFGVFFLLLFSILAGWWFRYVILGLGAVSIAYGIGHGRSARTTKG